jgi:hypothetical protein
MPPELREAAAKDFERWAAVARERPGRGARGLRLAVAVSQSFWQVKSDIFLAVHAFRAAFSRTDLEWSFNRLYGEHPSEYPAVCLFLKSLCLAVCREDFELMESIVCARPSALKDAYSILQAHPLRRVAESMPRARASAAARPEPPAFNHDRPPERPVSRDETELWSQGLLSALAASGSHPR